MLNVFSWATLITVAIPFALWFNAIGHPSDYLGSDVPAGQLYYVLSKLAGLIGLALLVLQLSFVHIGRRVTNVRLGWGRRKHMVMGVAICCLVSLHVVLFVVAVSLRSGHLALGPLMLRFTQGFYDQMLSIGAIAFYLLLLMALGGYAFLKRYKQAWVRRAHGGIALVVATLAAGHSFAIGSETNSLPMMMFYAVLAGGLMRGVWNAFNSNANS